MTINTNINPYYDDFDPEKNHLQILFKPGVPVQARELTQIQTIIQDQIRLFGNHIFAHGTPVHGGQLSVDTVSYVKVESVVSGIAIDYEGLKNQKITNSSGDVGGVVVDVDSTNEVVYVIHNENGSEFSLGDTLSSENGISVRVMGEVDSVGLSKRVSLLEGYYFIEGRFVHVPSTTIIPEPFNDNISGVVGLTYSERFITANDDPTLNDPSKGSYGFSGEGADRLYIETELEYFTYPNLDEERENFIELIEFVDGVRRIHVDRTEYDKLGETLARRTYDESGNYTVNPFQIDVLDSDELSIFSIEKSGAVAPKTAVVKSNIPHDFDIGDPIIVSGVVGDDSEIYNGEFVVDTVIDDVTFTYIMDFEPTSNAPQDDISNGVYVDMKIERPDYYRVRVSKGKAYVYGYEINKVDFTDLYETRARDTETIQNFRATVNSGTYVIANSNIPLSAGQTINFRNSSNTTVGSAIISSVQKHSNTRVKIYFINYEEIVSTSFSNVTNISVAGSGTSTLVNSTVFGSNSNLLIDVPYTSVATMLPNGVSDTSIVVSESFTQAGSTNMVFNVAGNFFNGPTGTNIVGTAFESNFTFTDNGGIVNPNSIVIDASSENLTATFATSPTGTVRANLSVQKNITSFRSKTLRTQNITKTIVNTNVMELDHPDIFRIVSVMNGSNDVTGDYVLDNGQRDDLYDHGSIRNVNGNLSATLEVTFEWFEHTGSGPITVDSYGIPYGQIPTYINSSGDNIRLTDVIDLRPIRTPNSNAISFLDDVAAPNSTVSSDYEFYLPRRDRVVVYKDGRFDIIKGEPSLNPVLPPEPEFAMTLYELFIPPYTNNVSDITVKFVENKRYTMRDIGKLENRIERMEYYVSLSLLEMDTKNVPVFDNSNIERFKNGFLTDNFSGHKIGDVINGEYKCSIDPTNRELRASFLADNIDMQIDSQIFNSNQISCKYGDFITLPFTEENLIRNMDASDFESVNPFLVVDVVGNMSLNPDSDTWFDVTRLPTVQANTVGDLSNFTETIDANQRGGLSSWGTQFNFWQTLWNGVNTSEVLSSRNVTDQNNVSVGNNIFNINTTDSRRQLRTGTTNSLGLDRIEAREGERVVDRNVVPFIRENTVFVTIDGLRPNRDHFAFIDDTRIDANVQASTQNTPLSEGSVRTDSNGSAMFVVTIPNGVFRTGTRIFRLIDDPTNNTSFATSYAEAEYEATGTRIIIEPAPPPPPPAPARNNNNFNPRNRRGEREEETRDRTDPLAQTFFVSPNAYPNGVMLSSVDLFFRRSAIGENIPVVVEVRPTVNGFPHSTRILKYGVTTKNADEINIPSNVNNISSIRNSPTNFEFDVPLYLEPNQEYAIVVKSNTSNYECYISELGQNLFGTNKTITKQQTLGSLFKSQNSSTWTPFQYQDLMININRCVFDTDQDGKITFNSPTISDPLFINEINWNPEIIEFQPDTKVTHEISLTTVSGSPETPFNVFKGINKQTNKTFKSENAGDVKIESTFGTANRDVSPIFNLKKAGLIVVENLISDDNSNETDPTNGNALAKYVTKPIVLAEQFESNFLKVYFDGYIPNGTDIEVYYKPKSATDSRPLSALPWIKMTPENTFISGGENDFRESIFNADAPFTFKTVSVKIVMLSSNASVVPKVRDLRVITGAP